MELARSAFIKAHEAAEAERVKLAHVFFIEYLRLLNHYGVLDEQQAK